MTLKIMCTYAHYVTLGSRCRMASSHRVTDLEKIQFESPRMKLRRHCQCLGLYLFPPCISRTLLGAWRFSLFRSVYSSFHNRLDLIRVSAFYWVFYFIFPIFYFPCFFHHMYKWKSSVRSSSIDLRFRGLPGLGFGVGLVTGSCHSLFFLLACPFVSRVISFIYDVRVRG